jgi:predicted MFS family arabinose efflux permease
VYRYTTRDAGDRDRAPSPRQHAAENSRDQAFGRDAPTLLSYAALAGYAFWLYAFGPALALLQAELHFSYTMLGVYSALWSAGAALAGLSFAGLARRLSRAALLWYSAAGAAAGAGLFAAARTVPLTLLGAAVLGCAGTTVLICTQAILSDRHGERRDRALTEANVGAAACAVLAPLLLGLLLHTPAGWRPALGLPALILAGLYLRYRHQPLPAAPAGPSAEGRARLPVSCWLLATLVAVGIAVEFCLVYFGAESLAATGLRAAQAATAMSGFYLGILAGRVGGAWLTRRAGRAVPLLWASLAMTAAGFGLFWLAGLPVVAIAGLFFCGLGIANLYPLSLPSPWPPRAAAATPPTPVLRSSAACSSSPLPTFSAASPTTSDCAPHSRSSRCSSEHARSCSSPDSGSGGMGITHSHAQYWLCRSVVGAKWRVSSSSNSSAGSGCEK